MAASIIEQENYKALGLDKTELTPGAVDALEVIGGDAAALGFLSTFADPLDTAPDMGGLTAFPDGSSGRAFQGQSRVITLTGAAGGEYVVVSYGFGGMFCAAETLTKPTAGPFVAVTRCADPNNGIGATIRRYGGFDQVDFAHMYRVPFFEAIGGVGDPESGSSPAGFPKLGLFVGEAQVMGVMRVRVAPASGTAIAPTVEAVAADDLTRSHLWSTGGKLASAVTYADFDTRDTRRYYGGATVRVFEPNATLTCPNIVQEAGMAAESVPTCPEVWCPSVRFFLPAGVVAEIDVGMSFLLRSAPMYPLAPKLDSRFSKSGLAIIAYLRAHNRTSGNTFNIFKALAAGGPKLLRKAAALYQRSRREAASVAPTLMALGFGAEIAGIITSETPVGMPLMAAGSAFGTTGAALQAYSKADVTQLAKAIASKVKVKAAKKKAGGPKSRRKGKGPARRSKA